jgi:hypothetical protein
MSELPDGLPNTCLDCISTTIEDMGKGRYKLIASKNGNHAVMLTSINDMAAPLLEELTQTLESDEQRDQHAA